MRYAILLFFLAACGAQPEQAAQTPAEPPVNNAATKYVGALQQSVSKAEQNAAKAQEAVARTQKAIDQANELP